MDVRYPIHPGQHVQVVPKHAERGLFDLFGTLRTGVVVKIVDKQVYPDGTYGLMPAGHEGYWFAAAHFELVDPPNVSLEVIKNGAS